MASLALSLLLSAAPARAGTYTWTTTDPSTGQVTAQSPTFSGGTVTVTTSLKPAGSRHPPPPAFYTSGGYYSGGGGCVTSSSAPASAPCGGSTPCSVKANSPANPIIATFTWQPAQGMDNTTDPPPPAAIVEQNCTASWDADELDGTATAMGTADCGLPDATVTQTFDDSGTLIGVTSSGTKYSVVASPGTSFTIPTQSDGAYKPTASYTVSSGSSGAGNGSAGVDYQVQAFPVIVALGGTTKDSSGNDNILIGQGCVPNMSAGPCTLSNFQWDPGGDTFDKFEVASDFSTGHVVLLGGDALSKPSPLWHYSKDSNGDTFTVKCSATATINGTTLGTVQGQRDVQVWVPYYLFKNSAGPVSVANRFDGLELYAGGPPVGGAGSGNWDPPGMENGGRVGTPDLFRSPGLGLWQFVQLATPGRWYYRMQAGATFMDGYAGNGEYGLDNSYPYPAPAGAYTPPYPADSVDTSTPSTPTYRMTDSPGSGLDDGHYRYRIDESFDDYMMYEPPDAGYGSDWVPLHLFKWKWQADISQIGNGWAAGWTPTVPGYVSNISSVRCTLHPFWENLLLNSN